MPPSISTNLDLSWTTALQWAEANVSSSVSIAAFFVSVCSLLFVAFSFRGTKKSGDLTSLIKFVESLQNTERAFLTADKTEKDAKFRELLDFLEMYSAAYNAGLLPKTAKKFVADKLISSIALIRRSVEWSKKFDDAKVGRNAFEDLLSFEVRKQNLIEKMKD